MHYTEIKIYLFYKSELFLAKQHTQLYTSSNIIPVLCKMLVEGCQCMYQTLQYTHTHIQFLYLCICSSISFFRLGWLFKVEPLRNCCSRQDTIPVTQSTQGALQQRCYNSDYRYPTTESFCIDILCIKLQTHDKQMLNKCWPTLLLANISVTHNILLDNNVVEMAGSADDNDIAAYTSDI